MLDVGSEFGRHLAAYCKWKPKGRIAFLVDELFFWVNACKQTFHPNTPAFILAGRSPYKCEFNNCPHPVIAMLCGQLEDRERSAMNLAPFSPKSNDAWAALFRVIVESAFTEETLARFLTEHFVAKSRKQKSGHGLAKQYLIRKIRERLKTLAGIKAQTK